MEDIKDETVTILPEVISLNVGGTLYTTSRATLQREKSSMLAALFSGRYKIPTDENGHFFIDRNGRHFSFILAYLRGESCQPPPFLAVEVLEEAEYFQIHGLIEALQVYPSVFQAKLFKRIDEKFHTQFWKREMAMKSQNRCLETLSSSSCVSFINEESIELLSEEPSCINSEHLILVKRDRKMGHSYIEETFDELATRMQNVDCILKNIRTKDMNLFLSSLKRRLDNENYIYTLTEESSTCQARNGHKSKNSCDFQIRCFYIEFSWTTGCYEEPI